MGVFKRLTGVFLIVVCNISLKAQKVDAVFSKTYCGKTDLVLYHAPEKKRTFSGNLIVPAVMVAYGLATIKSDPLQDINEELQRKIWMDHPHNKIRIDDYLQFAPAVAVYGLNIAGVKGKNNFRDRSIIYFMSNVFLNVTVSSVKSITHELRPDRSDRLSFPSGHTAEAFASAEFLRQEYKDISAWYSIAGYVAATATGILRLYNNKHWLNDIVAGAGTGIASTKLAYWIYPAICKKLFHTNKLDTTLMPYYQNKEAGLCMLYIVH